MKIDFRNIPGTADLFNDYIYDFEKVADFYTCAPYNESGYTELFDALSKRKYHRDTIADVLVEQNQSYGNEEPSIHSIERLRDDDTLVVFTGQQVGLFGGPLYTIYKAMTAINLARYLTVTTPYTFLPLFWVEGEDHDFEEVRSAYFIDRQNNLQRLVYNPVTPFEGQCVGKMELDETISLLIDEYAKKTHPTDFKKELLEKLKECYAPGSTLADAFARWMAYLLGPYGLILADPSDVRLKRLAAPVYKRSLKKHRSRVNPALSAMNEKLQDRGYHVQVGHRMDTLDFFYHNPRRLPLIREDGTYYLKDSDRHFTPDNLLDMLDNEIENFSPNVVLRPQVQDYLFPTAAYVGGPSEVAYFAQFSKIYDVFDTPMPIIYPRKSITLVEGKVQKVLDKYDITFNEIFGSSQDLERRVLKDQIPESLHNEFAETQKMVEERLKRLEKEAGDFNPNLKPVIGSLKGKLHKELAHAESRIASEIEKKDNIVKRQLEKAMVNLYPDDRLQERRLNVLSFFHKYFHKFTYILMELTCCRHELNHQVWRLDLF